MNRSITWLQNNIHRTKESDFNQVIAMKVVRNRDGANRILVEVSMQEVCPKQLRGGVSMNCTGEECQWSWFMGDDQEFSSGQLHWILVGSQIGESVDQRISPGSLGTLGWCQHILLQLSDCMISLKERFQTEEDRGIVTEVQIFPNFVYFLGQTAFKRSALLNYIQTRIT